MFVWFYGFCVFFVCLFMSFFGGVLSVSCVCSVCLSTGQVVIAVYSLDG